MTVLKVLSSVCRFQLQFANKARSVIFGCYDGFCAAQLLHKLVRLFQKSRVLIAIALLFSCTREICAGNDEDWKDRSKSAARSNRVGNKSLSLEEYNQAIELLRLKPDEDPSTMLDLLLNKVSVLLELNRLDEAAKILKTVNRAVKSEKLDNTLLQVRYLRRYVKLAKKQKNFKTATDAQKQLISLVGSIFGKHCAFYFSETQILRLLAERSGDWELVLDIGNEYENVRRSCQSPVTKRKCQIELIELTSDFCQLAQFNNKSEQQILDLLNKFESICHDRQAVALLEATAAGQSKFEAVQTRALKKLDALGPKITDNIRSKRCGLSAALMFERVAGSDFGSGTLSLAESAISDLRFFPPDDIFQAQLYSMKGVILAKQGKLNDAERTLGEVPSLKARKLGDLGPIFTGRLNLGNAFLDAGDPTGARRQISVLRKVLDGQASLPKAEKEEGMSQIRGYEGKIRTGEKRLF